MSKKSKKMTPLSKGMAAMSPTFPLKKPSRIGKVDTEGYTPKSARAGKRASKAREKRLSKVAM